MSSQPIGRSPDLKRLRDEGYDIAVIDGYLLVRDVPYVNANRAVCRGALLMALTLADNVAQPPGNHQAQFAGDFPCHADGREISEIRYSTANFTVGGLTARFDFSAKPKPADKYLDFYEKVLAYVRRISGPAQELEPDGDHDPRTYPLVNEDDEDSVFRYVDTASSRAEIVSVSKKLKGHRVAILGLGGTGGYILDLVAKTHVEEIHIFDGDVFSQHNAFRAPGAAAGAELAEKLPKVVYFARIYDRMRRGVIPHPEFISADNVADLDAMDFVFLAMEAGDVKRLVVERLLAKGIPFVDVGMGVYLANDMLGGTLRVTTATARKHDHLSDRMPFSNGGIKGEYDKNIQIAELNAMNAALAVIRWKKLFGIYPDHSNEHYSTYVIGRNDMNNEDEAQG